MAADLESGIRSRYEQDRSWLTAQPRRPDPQGPALLLRLLLPPRDRTRENRANLYGALPELRAHAQRGLRQADVHARRASCSSTSATATRSRTTKSDQFARQCRRPRRAPAPRRARRSRPPKARGSSTRGATPPSSTRTSPTRRGAARTFRGRRRPSSTLGTRLDIASLDTQGRFTVPTPITGDAAFNAFVQPLIDRYGYLPNGARVGRRHRRLRRSVQRPGLLPRRRPVRLQPHAGRRRSATTCTSGYQWYRRLGGSDPQLERLGRHHASPADARRLTRPADLLHGAVSSSRARAGLPPIVLGLRVAEHRVQRHDPLEELDVQRGPARQQRHAVRPGPARKTTSTLSGYVVGAGQPVQDVRDPLQEDAPAAPGRHLGRTTARTRSTRATRATTRPPARCRAPRRGIATWSARSSTRTSTRTACSSPPCPVGSSSGKLFVEDMTPRTDRRVHDRHAQQLSHNWSARVYGRYRHEQPLLGRHQQQRPRRPSTHRRAFRASCTSRT